MRIALAIEHLDRRRGGAETYIHDFAAWLRRQGHAVDIITQSAAKAPEGVGVHLTGAGCPLRSCRAAAFAERSAEALRELAPDVSMATGKALGARVYQPHGGTVRGSQRQNLAMIASLPRRALKSIFNRLSPKHRAFRRIEARQFADPRARFVAISRMVQSDMRTFYRVPPERITLVYNGVDLERFSPEQARSGRQAARAAHGIAEGATVLLMIAHNPRLKGLGETIRALALLPEAERRDVRLLVVGRAHMGGFRRLARTRGVEQNVVFARATDDVVPLYGAADGYVQPTWYDPCSLTTLEALACGLPVLTSRFNGARELMDGRGAGVIVDAPRPVARLAEALHALLDADARQAMSAAARAVAEEHPSEANFRAMLDVLKRNAETAPR